MSPTLRTGPVRVRVPASSANLGPGFDAFGLAVSLHDHVVARVTDGGLAVEVEGEGAESVSRDESNLVVSSLRAGLDALGVSAPGLRVGCLNQVPHGRGLGSSAAAIVGGLVTARALVEDGEALLGDDALLQLAAGIEGHPDNVAAALFGGFTVAWTGADGVPGAVRLDADPRVVPIACVPATPVSTSTARGLLPATVPHADAARNAGRAALLVTALTGRPDLLLAATDDALHQEYRRPAYPQTLALVDALRAAGVPAVVSGAGPTVMALATADDRTTVLDVVQAAAGSDFVVRPLEVDAPGAVAEVLPG
jgi:homoserine kinase